MALPAGTTWEVRTTGSDTLNSGGFVAGASGTDYSQQNAAQYSGTDLVVDGTTNTKVTSAGHSFVATDVGNLLRVTAGAGWTVGFYQIVSVAAGAATLDRSPAAVSTTGGSYCVGGALASPGQAAGAMVAGNKIWVGTGTYTIASATANVSGGCVTLPGGSNGPAQMEGYKTSRGDRDTTGRPLLQASGISTFTVITAGSQSLVDNIAVDGAGLTSSRAFNFGAGNGGAVQRCKALNCTNGGFNLATNTRSYLCVATGCSGAVAAFSCSSFGICIACVSYNNSTVGFAVGTGTTCINCLSINNSGASSDGFQWGSSSGTCVNCVAYKNGRDGFRTSSSTGGAQSTCLNCLSVSNSGSGFNAGSTAPDSTWLFNCAAWSNTAGNVNTNIPAADQQGFVNLTGDPFSNAVGNDFSLNNTAGAGAACRAAGMPGVYPSDISTTGYADMGAVQHQDPAGGGGGCAPAPIMSGKAYVYG